MADKFPDFRGFVNEVTNHLGDSATLLPPAKEIAKLEPDIDFEEANQMLKSLCECEIAEELKALIMMPQELQLYWQNGKAMGELFLGNTSEIDYRLVDPSQHSLEFFGAPLSDYRIIDEVSIVGGPFFTLVKREGNRLDSRLFFFDTRDCWKMDIAVADYIDLAMKTFAPLYWQCLFIDHPLIASRADMLSASIDFLRLQADPTALDRLERALHSKK